MEGAGRSVEAAQQNIAQAVPSTSAPAGQHALSTTLAQIFEQSGTLVRLARHQPLSAIPTGDDCSYLVRSGTLALETSIPARHILGFWHGGDLIELAPMPLLPRLGLRALEPAELWRLRQNASDPMFGATVEARAAHRRASAISLKQMLIANTMLATLSGEERLVTFLASMAVRIGKLTANRVAMRMPMSRVDVADHLGLNPDTLSRLVTSLKEEDLIRSQGRHGLIVLDWQSLLSRTPLAGALLEI